MMRGGDFFFQIPHSAISYGFFLPFMRNFTLIIEVRRLEMATGAYPSGSLAPYLHPRWLNVPS